MWKAIASNALTLMIVILVTAAGMVAWARNEFQKPGPLADAICLQVREGAAFSAISRNLEERGAITDARLFRISAGYMERTDDLKFGSYLIKPGTSMAEVLESLTAGGASTCGQEVIFRIGVSKIDVVLRELDPATNDFVEVVKFEAGVEAVPAEYTEAAGQADMRFQITVAEGATSWQIVDGLRKADFLEGEIAAVPPEGSLAPQSFEVARGSDRAGLVEKMSATQVAIMAELWPQRSSDLPYDTPEEAMIMASIVEKETGVAEERPVVASVFVNRLNAGMKLQTDPTVIYGITNGEGVLGRGLRQSELRRETPYNTYVIDGLPPTPIANPGRKAIEAALNPAESEFVFFVADGTGGHAFAVTLDEHNRNVEKWRAIEAEQAEAAEGQEAEN